MAEHRTTNVIKETYKRIFLPLAAAVLSTVILVLCVLTLLEVNERGYESAPKYLVWVFVLLGLSNIVSFLKERTKINLIKCAAMLLFDVALGIVILFGKNNPYLFSFVAGLYCVGVLATRVFQMIQQRTVRSYVLNGLIILLLLVLSFGLFANVSSDEGIINSVILLECVIVAVASFLEVFSVAMSQLRLKTLMSIILRTYALEIIFGLLAMMVSFALVFVYVEEDINNFGDAIWYCFAVVTTIGFGDFTCKTLIGRLLTVFLGVYGLIVVAVLTSIFVNLYNETAGKADKKEINKIEREENKKK